jgi:hypothetical protein
MIVETGAAMLIQLQAADATGGLYLGDTGPRPRLVVVGTVVAQTPLPDWLESCPLDAPTGTAHVVPSLGEKVVSAYNHAHELAAELTIDPEAQALVDRLVEANAPPRGKKRVLAPRLR